MERKNMDLMGIMIFLAIILASNLAIAATFRVDSDVGVESSQLFVNTTTGYVGIGTSTPSSPLHVVGDANIIGNLSTPTLYEVSTQGLVLAMNFNNASITGTTVLDSSGYNNHGTIVGATFNSTGGFNGGGAFEFDGSGDYIIISDDDSLNFGKNDFTLESWFKNAEPVTNSSTIHYIISKHVGDSGYHLSLRGGAPNGTYFRTRNSTNITNAIPSQNYSGVVSDGNWHHVVGVRSGSKAKIYLDGELIGETTKPVINITQSINLYIGTYYNAGALLYNFTGTIDEVRIWNRALSSQEIKNNYLKRAEVHDSYVSQKDLTVDSSGNVGIGTTSPEEILNIEGTGTITLKIEDTGVDVGGGNIKLVTSRTGSTSNINDYGGFLNWIFMNNASTPEEIKIGDIYGLVTNVTDGSEDGDLIFREMVNGALTEIMRFNAGNVGIGTSSPAVKLDIDTGSNTGGLRLRGVAETVEIGDIYMDSGGQLVISTIAGTDTVAHIDLRPEDNEYGLVLRESNGTGLTPYANFYVVNAADDYMSITINSATDSDSLVVTASDRVGIGTNTPSTKFHIKTPDNTVATFESTDPITILNFIDSDGNMSIRTDGARFQLRSSVGGGGNILFQANSVEVVINEGGTTTDFRAEGTTDDHLFFVDASANRVGIGTDSPDAKLHVVDNSSTDGIPLMISNEDTTDGNKNFLLFRGINIAAAPINYGAIKVTALNHTGGNISSNMQFMLPNTTASLQTHLTILQGGNVGIGTTGPSVKLDVSETSGTFGGAVSMSVGVSGVGMYYATSASSQSCITTCENEDANAGFDAASGQCLAAWSSTNTVLLCASTTTDLKCLCLGSF